MAARYLAELSDAELNNWLVENNNVPSCKETLLLLGGTSRLGFVVETLLKMKNIDDPISTIPVLIAGILAEADDIPIDLLDQTLAHLLPRLTSDIPSLVDEAVSVLLPIGKIAPELIGPNVLALSTHKNPWTVEAACILGLVSGNQYVNQEVLWSIYLKTQEFSSSFRAHRFGFMRRNNINILLIEGGQYLIDRNRSKFKKTVKERYKDITNLSIDTTTQFESLLRNVFSPSELSKMSKFNWEWTLNLPDLDKLDNINQS